MKRDKTKVDATVHAPQAKGVLVAVDIEKDIASGPLPLSLKPKTAFIGSAQKGSLKETNLPDSPDGFVSLPWLSRKGGVVYIDGIVQPISNGGNAVFVPTDLSRRVELGKAVKVFPGVDVDSVWLLSKDNTLEKVSTDAKFLSPLYHVPKERTVVGMVADGAVTIPPDDQHSLEIWDPVTSGVIRKINNTGFVTVASSRYLEDLDRGNCISQCLAYLRPIDGGDSLMFKPDSQQEWMARAVSPDGTKYALLQHPVKSEVDGLVDSTVVVYEIPTGKEVARHSARTWSGQQELQWDPTSQWIYFGQDSSHVVMFRLDNPAQSATQFPVGDATGFVVTN